MSTTPRVQSPVVGEPAVFRTVLGHQRDVFGAFWRLYGTFWSHGQLDHATKEVARMRNARVTDCGYCKNVRFSEARREGLVEETVGLIEDDFDDSNLSERNKLVLRFTDAFLNNSGRMSASLADALHAEFTDGEIAELAMGVSLFMGFAKVLISLGLEPEQMDVILVATPNVTL